MEYKSNFENLVHQNIQEILRDEKRLSQIELQLEKKHEELARKEHKTG